MASEAVSMQPGSKELVVEERPARRRAQTRGAPRHSYGKVWSQQDGGAVEQSECAMYGQCI